MENQEISNWSDNKDSNLVWSGDIITIISSLALLVLIVVPLGLNIFFGVIFLGFAIISFIIWHTDYFHYIYPHEPLYFDESKIIPLTLGGVYELRREYENLKGKQRRKFLFELYHIPWYKRFNERGITDYIAKIGTIFSMGGFIFTSLFGI